MRYKALLLAVFVLLIATPVYAQTASPVTVETLDTTPTLVRTGQLFVQGYRIRYLDLSRYGEKVIIYDDKIQTGFLSLPAEIGVVAFDDGKENERKKGNETTRDIFFTLRVIGAEKGSKKLLKSKLEWAIQRAGQTEENAENQESIETEKEVYINYVTTVTKDPFLDIKDKADFGDRKSLAWTLWLMSRVMSPIAVLLPLVWAVLYLRRRKPVSEKEADSVRTESEDREEPELEVSFAEAYRQFFRGLGKIEKDYSPFNDVKTNKDKMLELERKLFSLVRNLVAAKMGNLNPGDTPNRIHEMSENQGKYRIPLSWLTDRLVRYEQDIESGESLAFKSCDLASEVTFLSKMARLLRKRGRLAALFQRGR